MMNMNMEIKSENDETSGVNMKIKSENGETSGVKVEPHDDEYANQVWAKLVPSDSRYVNVEIKSNEVLISSETMSSSSEKYEWCKITRNSDLCSAVVQNKSFKPIFVDDVLIQSGHDMHIKCGDEIIAGPDREGYLTYKFEVIPAHELVNNKIQICIDVEHAKCSICLNVWHDVVTAAPCLHNFCNGCFSEWLRRCQMKHSSVLCPQCRAVVQYVGKNHFLHNIEEDIMKADASLLRSDEELALLNSYASIRSSLVITSGKRLPRKRARSSTNTDDNSSTQYPCPQCGSEVGGFRCNQSTVHLQCHACGGMMPSRTNISSPQYCVGCDRAYCGAYWQAQNVTSSDSHPVCSSGDTFKPISERTTSGIPLTAHEKNRHEQVITERCIIQMGRTVQDVVSEWIAKLNNREIDRSRMPLNHAEMITSGTYTCSDCYEKLVSFVLYWFRVSLPMHHLPPDASNRGDCWYGYACRTQHHNDDHARKRNHVCRPVRGRDGSHT